MVSCVHEEVTKDLDSPEEKMEIQRFYLARMAFIQNMYNIPIKLGSRWCHPQKSTLEKTGSTSMQLLCYGDKRQVTVMLAGNMKGEVLKPFIVFAGISNEKLKEQRTWIVCYQRAD